MEVMLALPSMAALLGALFLAVLTRTRHQRNMIWLMLDFSVAFIYLVFGKLQNLGITFLLDWVSTTAVLFIPFLVYNFFTSLTKRTSKKVLKAMLYTAAAISAANFILYAAMGFGTAEYYCKLVTFGEGLNASSPVIFWVKRIIGSYIYRSAVLILLALGIFSASKALKEHHSKLNEYYSNVEEDFAIGNRNICAALVLLALATIFFLSRPFPRGTEVPTLYMIGSPIVCISLILLIVYGYQQEMSLDDLNLLSGINLKNPAPKSDSSSEPSAEAAADVILARVEKCIANKFYLNPDISLDWMSRMVGTNRTYLSEFIHTRYSASFSDFINSMRADYAENLIRMTSEPLGDIAVKSGFRSKSSFYRNYSRFKKQSPAETRQETKK